MATPHSIKVDQWIESLSNDHMALAAACRHLIFETVPQVTEKYSFSLPFYHYFGMFCYLNKAENGVVLGLCRGKDLLLAYPQLEMGNRKMVASVRLTQLNDIYLYKVPELLAGAAVWQAEAAMHKRPFVHSGRKKANK